MLDMDGRDGDCWSCCLFARSGETGKRGVPGEPGNLKTGSMGLDLMTSYPHVLKPEMKVAERGIANIEKVRDRNRRRCASYLTLLGNARFALMHCA